MPNETTIYTLYPEAEIAEHVRYFDGQFLGSQDFVDVQRYLIDRIRRGLDLLTVAGVARGLEVSSPGAWTLQVSAGTAIDPHGRLLVVPAALTGVAVPQEHKGKTIDVALAYAEVPDRVQGGNSEEAGTRGATRVREAPEVRFYAAGLTPAAEAVVLARVNVAADGTCSFVVPDPVRRRAGVRLPSEDAAESPSIRDGGPARPRTLEVDGTVAVQGKLAVGTLDPEANVDLRGLTKIDALHVRERSFRVEGDVAKFYPIVWEDLGWSSGALELEITRADADVDAAGAGSLVARLRVHPPDGAHGSAFAELEIHQSKRFIAGYSIGKTGRSLIVWLRGARTYAWRGSHHARLADVSAADKQVGGNNFVVLDSVRAEVDYDRVKIHAPLDQHQVQGPLSVDGDLTYGGKLSKLDTAEVAGATIRSHDLYLGHSSRRGSPGRALVDDKATLVVNFGADWSSTRVASPLTVGGDTTIAGDLAIGSDAARKGLDVSGSATIDQALSVGGLTNLGGNLNVGSERARRGLAVSGGAQVDQALTVGGKATLQGALEVVGAAAFKANVSVGTDEARKNLTVTGTAQIDQRLTVTASSRVLAEDAHLVLQRAKTETTGGVKILLELQQEDTSQKAVPEVATAIRFHHNGRYWHRIEGDAAGIHVRDGNPANNSYKPLHSGALTVAGALAVSGDATVDGRATVGQLSITHAEFKVAGERAKFYPVVFEDRGWASGFYHLEINRPDVHADGQWTGSLMARFEGHAASWGHGSNYHRIHVRQFKSRFIAGIEQVNEDRRIILWLRGNCTYRWRAWSPMTLNDFNANAKVIKNGDVTRSYAIKDAIAGYWDQDTVYIGPEASGQSETDLKIIRGTVTAGGGIAAGSGFSVTKFGNTWNVIYSIPFTGEVTVVATQQYPDHNDHNSTGNTRDNAVVVASTREACWIKTGDGDGDLSWRRFHFIAMGQG